MSLVLFFIFVSFLSIHVRSQYQHFYSEPTLNPPSLIVITNNAKLVNSGYIFTTPVADAQPGPLIFAQDGTLIWDGTGFLNNNYGIDLTVCYYENTPHLCFAREIEGAGYGRGDGIILDQQYNLVKTINSGNGLPPLDIHELRVVDEGSKVLYTIYDQIPYDTTPYGINASWVTSGVFQEQDLASGSIVFQWSSIDHVPVTSSQVLPGTTDVSGDGKSNSTAWDYFHINSIDKDPDANYYVSARHTKTIYKINGTDGSIIWQLGGLHSNFTMDYEFNFQHFARFEGANQSHTLLSLFDNGADDNAPPSGQTKSGYEPYSSGLVVWIDTSTMTSTLRERYVSPNHVLSVSQGNLQFQSNGNKFIGYGQEPDMIEYTNNITGQAQVVYYALISAPNATQVNSYRNLKFPWTAQPSAPPALFIYAQDCSSTSYFYASWNGATGVDHWRFGTSNSSEGPFLDVLGAQPKTGFETVAYGELFATFAIACAYDKNDRLLGASNVTKIFIPADASADCVLENCGPTYDYTNAAQQTC